MKLVQFAVVVFALVGAQSAIANEFGPPPCPFQSQIARTARSNPEVSNSKEAPKQLPATKGEGADGARH